MVSRTRSPSALRVVVRHTFIEVRDTRPEEADQMTSGMCGRRACSDSALLKSSEQDLPLKKIREEKDGVEFELSGLSDVDTDSEDRPVQLKLPCYDFLQSRQVSAEPCKEEEELAAESADGVAPQVERLQSQLLFGKSWSCLYFDGEEEPPADPRAEGAPPGAGLGLPKLPLPARHRAEESFGDSPSHDSSEPASFGDTPMHDDRVTREDLEKLLAGLLLSEQGRACAATASPERQLRDGAQVLAWRPAPPQAAPAGQACAVHPVQWQLRLYEVPVEQMQASTLGRESCPGEAQREVQREAGAEDVPEEIPVSRRTTVMLRNLPNNYSRAMVLATLDGEGFAGMYDFLYLPIDFKSRACLGYAFVNLVGPDVVGPFWSKFDGYTGWMLPSKKVCSVSWSGPYQGLSAHIARYRNSPVMHSTVPEEYKPAIFLSGVQMVFPPPTKSPRAPRMRRGTRVFSG